MINTGDALHNHVATLFPICRSITGAGLRQTLDYIGTHLPLQVHNIPSGTRVLDWEIPPEWTVRGASISTLDGHKLIDFEDNNLHLLQYSTPLDRIVTHEELDAHLYSLPEQPSLIPYRTSYYTPNWGFCLADRDRRMLTDTAYRVVVDTVLAPGTLSYGEYFLPGTTSQEVLFSAHCCHPSLANDNLSSIALAIELARALGRRPRRFSYRFLFAPGTVGAITWLHFNRDASKRVAHGLVLTCLGDCAPPTYKRSRQGTAAIDRYATSLLRRRGHADRILPFAPTGYDERQFCSPGFDLPMGSLMRSPGGNFPQYHTSADNLSFVTPDALADSWDLLCDIIELIERDEVLLNTEPYGEPQLGRRGLYDGGLASNLDRTALLWVLNLSDGKHSLFDVAERSGLPFATIATAADALRDAGLLTPRDASSRSGAVTVDASAA